MVRRVDQVLDEVAKRLGDSPAHFEKVSGAWTPISWRQYRDVCRKSARALIALGLEPGKGVAIIGRSCHKWVVADVAAILAGGLPAGIYTTSSAEQCQYIADHCEAKVVVAEDATQVQKFLEVRASLPHLGTIVQMEGEPSAEGVISWKAFLAKGDAVSEADLDARIAAQKPDDVATLIYTSGTTGEPKAVMISHDNLTWTADTLVKAVGIDRDEQIGMSYLPLSHIAEQVLTIHGPMAMGSQVYFAESIEKLAENLSEVRPTVFLGVPRVWEKIQAKMMAAGAANPPLRKKIAAWARKLGLEGGYAEQRGEAKPVLYALADMLVFSKVKKKLGLDRARLCVTSAAPISKDTLEFFLSLGIVIVEVYGMSECTGPATFSRPDRYKTGKVGMVLPGGELKLAEDGEICMRGRHVFKGYLKSPEATAEALDADGWLHSGDIGTKDEDGFVQITDRKKDLLITAGGENVAPQVIEGLLKAIPVVGQAVVVGDRQKYLAALLTLDPERVVLEAELAGSPARTVGEAAKCAIFRKHLDVQVEKVNDTLARVQTIKKFVVLPTELTIEGGELTPTMKVKRKVVNAKYAREIESLYA